MFTNGCYNVVNGYYLNTCGKRLSLTVKYNYNQGG